MRYWYRQGCDISVPPYPQFRADKSLRVGNFPQILCYIQGEVLYGGGGFSRWPLLQLQTMNSPQVIIDVQCHVHSKRQRNLPAFAKEKQQLQLPGAHEYQLCIEDNQRATGFAEVMSAGCFPAFITSEWVCLPI